jgi:rod shape-determining protein MreC
LLVLALLAVRLSKGVGFTDAYALLSRPFWPGSAQGEWVRSGQALNDQTRLRQLDADNRRLRSLLELQGQGGRELAAAVISRQTGGWWQQLVIGRGELQGLRPGMAVTAPGGLIGRIAGVTPTTASVTLLTDPGSRVGVWVERVRRHGLLTGIGTSRPLLRFLEKDPGVRPGDVVVTSPASTLVPPNLTVGVIQSVDDRAVPATEAVVQLSAPLEAVDWVQVRLP